jgi:hypothetical protein
VRKSFIFVNAAKGSFSCIMIKGLGLVKLNTEKFVCSKAMDWVIRLF